MMTKVSWALTLFLGAAPAIISAQGSKISSPVELAARASELKPGEWVLAPQIAPAGPLIVIVDLSAQLARVYRNDVAIGVTSVSTGKPGHETPTGVFTILQKDAHHHSKTYNNAPMPFQQRLTWDGVALHAGGLPGYPESHGCVHLPFEFARELFTLSEMGGTVIISGRAGAPVRLAASDVLAPASVGGTAIAHRPLTGDEKWSWTEEAAPSGPLSIVVSTSESRIVVLRNGQEIGRSVIALADPSPGTHVYTLHRGTDGQPHWVMVGVPGHENEADHAIDTTLLAKLRMPRDFHTRLAKAVVPGTSVLVTSASVGAHNSGRRMTLVSASDSSEVL